MSRVIPERAGTPADLDHVIARSNTAISSGVGGGTTDLKTVTIPGGLPGPNDAFEIETLWTCNNSANLKAAVILFGAGIYLNENLASSNGLQTKQIIRNNNSLSAQKGNYVYNETVYLKITAGVLTTSAVDTSADFDIIFRAGSLTAGDELILEGYSIKLLRAV